MIVAMPRKILAPSILSANFLRLGEAIQACVDVGIEWFQLDVMDGHFVPNISFGPMVVRACREATDAFLDVHLMISEPNRYLEAFHDAGADLLTVHVEAVNQLEETISQIHRLGIKAGVALNPDTPEDILGDVIDSVDLVLVMSVNPGFAGQRFIPSTPEKIHRVREMLDQHGSQAYLQVDGGIDAETIGLAQMAGANVFVAASAVFQHEDGIAEGVRDLQEAIGISEG